MVVAGSCFILPAAAIVAALAWLYVHFGRLAAASAILYSVKPVVIAVVLQALRGLGKTAVNTTCFAGVSSRRSGCLLAGVFVGVGERAVDPANCRSKIAGAFSTALTSLALMAYVSWQLGRASLVDWIAAGWQSCCGSVSMARELSMAHPGRSRGGDRSLYDSLWFLASDLVIGI